MDLKQITEDLNELNTLDKISCVSAAMVDMSPDSVLEFLEGLKQTARKILNGEICRAKQIQDQYEKSAVGAKELQNKLLNVLDRL